MTTGKVRRPRPPKLRVVVFENESGTTSFRVVGFAGGERIRRNFPTRTEAELEKARRLAKHCGVVAPHTV